MEISHRTAVLVDAKNEYTSQLMECVQAPVLSVFNGLFSAAKSQKKHLIAFQRKLKEIPDWNGTIVKEHTESVLNKCGFFSELLTAVFVSHVKVLTSVRLGSTKPNIRVKVPSNENFVHLLYVECAREFYQNPYMFEDNDKQAKRDVVDACVERAVRKLLPVRDILRAYLGNTVDDERMYHEIAQLDAGADEEDDNNGNADDMASDSDDSGCDNEQPSPPSPQPQQPLQPTPQPQQQLQQPPQQPQQPPILAQDPMVQAAQAPAAAAPLNDFDEYVPQIKAVHIKQQPGPGGAVPAAAKPTATSFFSDASDDEEEELEKMA